MLQVDQVEGRRGDHLLFSRLCFQLPAGQALHIVGRNGAGKTTLLELLAGSCSLEKGRMFFTQKPEEESGPEGATQQEPKKKSGTLKRQEREKLKASDSLFLGAQHGFKAVLSAQENLFFWHQVYGNYGVSLSKALAYFDLESREETLYSDLSTGQKQRLSLTRLLLVDRPLWLLDEPFLGLDRDHCAQLTRLLGTHLKKGGYLCLASHTPLSFTAKRLELGAFKRGVEARGSPGFWRERENGMSVKKEPFLTQEEN